LSKKYGDIMQLKLGSIHTIVVSSPEIAKQVLKVHDLIFASLSETIARPFFLNMILHGHLLGTIGETCKRLAHYSFSLSKGLRLQECPR
jgi:hypothetical protein